MRLICPKGVNHHAVRAPVVDLEEPEGESKWGFVSGYEAGLRHHHDRLPKSKEGQIRALEKAVTNTAVLDNINRATSEGVAKWNE